MLLSTHVLYCTLGLPIAWLFLVLHLFRALKTVCVRYTLLSMLAGFPCSSSKYCVLVINIALFANNCGRAMLLNGLCKIYFF